MIISRTLQRHRNITHLLTRRTSNTSVINRTLSPRHRRNLQHKHNNGRTTHNLIRPNIYHLYQRHSHRRRHRYITVIRFHSQLQIYITRTNGSHILRTVNRQHERAHLSNPYQYTTQAKSEKSVQNETDKVNKVNRKPIVPVQTHTHGTSHHPPIFTPVGA